VARGSSQATGAATSAQNLSNTLGGNASALYSTLTPQLIGESVNPPGMNPADLAEANTSAQQSAGGSEAAAVGEGALRDARLRNRGGSAAAVSDASRGAGEQLSKNALGIRMANTALKEKQRQAGLGGLENLQESQMGGGIRALGEVAPAVDANTKAASQSWDWARTLLDPALEAGGRVASARLGH
jgi:hypothetical protein